MCMYGNKCKCVTVVNVCVHREINVCVCTEINVTVCPEGD